MTILNAEVFVTTYAIGNEHGFAVGKHFDLTDYADKDDFISDAIKYAEKLQKRVGVGAEDVELCFPDYECSDVLREYISEYGVESELWDVVELSGEYDLDMVAAYLGGFDQEATFEETCVKAEDRFVGRYEDETDYAWQYLEEAGYVGNNQILPDIVACNIDINGVAEWLMEGMYFDNGYLFHCS